MDDLLNDDTLPALAIGAVSRMTRLSARQIRYYERLGLVQPRRSGGGHRLYSKLDVERLICIRELLNRGVALSVIRELAQAAHAGVEESDCRAILGLESGSRAGAPSGAEGAREGELIERLARYERHLERRQP